MKYVASITQILRPDIHRMGSELLPRPDRVEIECESAEGPCFLIRYTSDGEFCGDTWHATFSDAVDQAKIEYGLREADFIAVAVSA